MAERPKRQLMTMGLKLPLPEDDVPRNVRRSHPGSVSTDPPPLERPPYEPNRTPGPFEMPVRDLSEHPPPPAYRLRARPPPVVQTEPDPKSGSVAIAGKGWRVNVPTVLVTGALASLGTWIANKATNESSTIREISAEQDREAKRAERDREERAKQDEAIRDRLDKLQTRVSVIEGQNVELDKSLDRLTERLERRRAVPPPEP